MTKVTDLQKADILETYTDAKADGDAYEALTNVILGLSISHELSIPQVRGIIVSEGVYVAKEKKDAKASTGMDKEALINAIQIVFGAEFKSMKNMSKKDLEVFWEKFNILSERANIGES